MKCPCGKEGVLQTGLGRDSLLGVKCQHGKQEVGKFLGCVAVPFIFLRENLVEGPGLELADMSEFTILPEEVLAVLAGQSDVGRDGAAELHDVGQVVLVPRVVVPTVRLEQVVACGQLEGHTGG